MRKLLAEAVAAALVFLGAGTTTSIRPVVIPKAIPKTALVYGDSLAYESKWKIDAEFKAKGWNSVSYAFVSALCDWTQRLAQDLQEVRPSVVAVETTGGSSTPCMLGSNGEQLVQGSALFFAKYRADMHTFFSTATAAGAKVVFIVGPPMLEPRWNATITSVESIARQVAASYPGVSVSNYARNSVSADGAYVSTLPCLAAETEAQGCADGEIVIRTVSGRQTGIHFCPSGLPLALPVQCLEYSSGEYRFGEAIARTTINPPSPIRPTVKMRGVSGPEGTTLGFRPSLLYPYSRDLELCYTTADGTATVATGDYSTTAGCFVIPAWTTAGPTISIPTTLDQTNEHTNEFFTVVIRGSSIPITEGTKSAPGVITLRVVAKHRS